MADNRSINLGQDANLDIINKTTGQTISFVNIGADLMDLQAEPVTNVVTRMPISNGGRSRRRVERVGYKGSITLGRINGDIEALEIQQQEIYRTGGTPYKFTLHLSVLNQDGSGTYSKYQYTNCDLYLTKDPGYKMGDDVTMTLEFQADDKKLIKQ